MNDAITAKQPADATAYQEQQGLEGRLVPPEQSKVEYLSAHQPAFEKALLLVVKQLAEEQAADPIARAGELLMVAAGALSAARTSDAARIQQLEAEL
eukprot:CAMPEP_0119065768 /NCGR_PEP_ID=MMETSP1178-20130426/8502_1 /TAXON_ID=33656 /ORGANISM="unid sp, Strain CCMP2000" /LENGTH=96 /DNA_ID=CAMNT_0007047315 /DNA_START=36 /DNA_END=323 /DNA_ORIENTATION=+